MGSQETERAAFLTAFEDEGQTAARQEMHNRKDMTAGTWSVIA